MNGDPQDVNATPDPVNEPRDPRDSWQPPGGLERRPYRRGDVARNQARRKHRR